MGHIVHDLFLLMLRLSQVKQPELVIRLFVDALHTYFPHANFEHKRNKPSDAFPSFEVASNSNSYGYIVCFGNSDSISKEHQLVLENCIQMVALILEKIKQDKLLLDKKLLLESEVEERAAQLIATEEKYHSIFNTAANLIILIDRQGIIKESNIRINEFLGYRQEEVINTSINTLLHEDTQDILNSIINETLEKGVSYGRTGKMIRKNGDQVFVNIDSAELQRMDKGSPGQIICIIENITEKLKSRRELEKEKKTLQTIFDLSIDLICIADVNTVRFIKTNPAFTRVLGFSEQELLEQPFMDFIHPDDRQATIDIMDERLQQGLRVINFQNRYRTTNGDYRWIEWVSHPDQDSGLVYAIGHDITNRKEAELSQEQDQQSQGINPAD